MKYFALKISLLCILIFFLQIYIPNFTQTFMLIQSKALLEPWRFFTHAFLHANFLHLLYNIFALSLFGTILEKLIGSKRFLILLFSSILFSGIVSFFLYNASLGISGGVFGILSCLSVIRPGMIVWFYGAPMPIIVALFFWALFNFIGLFFPSNIAYASHLAGIFVGVLYGLKLRKEFREEEKEEEFELSEEEIQEWEERYLKFSYIILLW